MQEDRNLLQQIKERFEIVKEKKDLEKLRLEAEKLKEASSQPDFWADNQTAQKTMQTLGEIESEISNVESLEQRIRDTLDMSQDVNDSDIEMSEMINE